MDINPSVETPIGDLDLRVIAEAAGYESDESEDGPGLEELKGGKHSDISTNIAMAKTSLENQTGASNAQPQLPGTALPLKQ